MLLSPEILIQAVANGLLTGAIYALIALGLTLIYGVLHIINFAHGALLTTALFAAFFADRGLGIDPWVSVFALAPAFFALGYVLQRIVIWPASRGEDRAILLVTLGLAVIIENGLLFQFRSDTRTIDHRFGFAVIELGPMLLATTRVVAFFAALAVAAALGVFLALTDTGRAIRAVAKERLGAELSGVEVSHIYAVTFGLGTACLAVAACLLLPSFYVTPQVGNAFVLVAFTIVVLGGMGSVPGALAGGLFIGVVESISGLLYGETLGQLGIFLIFILVLLVRPQGLFGAKA